jgi:hypothetical protein
MTDILVAIVAIMNLANGVLLFILIRNLTRTSADVHVDHHDGMHAELGYSEQLAIQDHVIAREEAFNERIRLMKEEANRVPTDAEELHPDVFNLPHHTIHTGTQGVETSE